MPAKMVTLSAGVQQLGGLAHIGFGRAQSSCARPSDRQARSGASVFR